METALAGLLIALKYLVYGYLLYIGGALCFIFIILGLMAFIAIRR